MARTHGNAAVQRLLQRGPATTTAPKRPTLHLGSRGPFVWTLQQKPVSAWS